MKKARTELEQAIIEREKRALSATWFGSKPDMHRYTAVDEDWAFRHGFGLTRVCVVHTYAGKAEFRRCARDRRPPSSVVTELLFPSPAPGRPMPGSPVDEIKAWNLRQIQEAP